MKKLKVVLIGAGSVSFGRGIIADFMASKELRELQLTVSLVDIDKVALNRMYQFANLLKDHYGAKAEIEATTNRKEALPGANYVVASIAKKRVELWETDYYIPISYGFRHVHAEGGGPGAAFHTLRSLHLTIPICKDMENLCPDALLINLTNPANRVSLGVAKLTRIRVVGICHSVFTTLDGIARVLGKSEEDIDLTIAGINHFHWVLQIRNGSNGKDLYPEFHQRMKQSDWGFDSLTRRMYEVFGLCPFPAASKIGEYVSFAHDVSGPVFTKWGIGGVSRVKDGKVSDHTYIHEGEINKPSYELSLIEEKNKIQRVVEGKEPLTEELAQTTDKYRSGVHLSRELIVSIIWDIEFDRRRREISVNVPNENSAISNLPEDAFVEVPAQVDAQGIHPIKVGALPEGIAAICRHQISIQNLLVEAYRQKSKKLLLHALILDPVVDSIDRAEEMMNHMLRIEADYLPLLH